MSARNFYRPEVDELRQVEIKVMQALQLMMPRRRDPVAVERYAVEQLIDEMISHLVAARLPLAASRPVRAVPDADSQEMPR